MDFWLGHLLVSGHFETPRGRITMETQGKSIATMKSGMFWFRIVSVGRIWY
jgi:hypothetical protein